MKMKAHAIMVILVALGLHPLKAQYGMGIAGGTWEGIWGVAAQPACLTLNPDKAEINVIQAGIDLDNSYLYLGREQFGLFGFGRRIRVDTTELDLGELRPGTDRAVTLDVRATAPSFSLRLGERSAVALTNRVRVAFSALDLDDLARKFGIDTITIDPGMSRRVDEARVKASGMSWTEHGISFAHVVPMGERSRLHTGITGKYLVGLYGLYLENGAPLLSAINDSVQTITEVDMNYGLVYPEGEPFSDGLRSVIHGRGWGGDGGFILEWGRKPKGDEVEERKGDHLLRIGASVTDLGSIRFNRNAQRHAIRNGRTTVDQLEAFSIDDVDQLDSALSAMLLDDPGASLAGLGFRQQLPAAVRISIDYSPVRRFAIRLEGVLAATAPTAGPAVREQVSVVPRFETRNVCVAAPVSLDGFGSWSFGLMLRAGGFMIGSDRIGALFGLNDLRGADVYFGAKVRLRGKKVPTTDG